MYTLYLGLEPEGEILLFIPTLYHIVLYHTIVHSIVISYTILYYAILYRHIIYHTVLYHTILSYHIPYYTLSRTLIVHVASCTSHSQVGTLEVGSFHTAPIRASIRPLFLMGVVWEPYGRLPTYKLPTCKGL